MNFEVVERDFIKRTLDIIEQYETHVMNSVTDGKQYEVTLLINCLLGLVVTPFEYKNREFKNRKGTKPKKAEQGDSDDLPEICGDDLTPYKELNHEWGLTYLKIEEFKERDNEVPPNQITLRKLIAMFRHSVAHSQFNDGNRRKPKGLSVGSTESEVPDFRSRITEVHFVNKYGKTVFRANMPIEGLKAFAKKLAETVLEERATLKP